MIDTITQAFLHCLADERRKAKGETLSVGPNHGLSIWLNENDLRNKIALAARNSNKNFTEILLETPAMAKHCMTNNLNAKEIPNKIFHLLVYGTKDSNNAPRQPKAPRLERRPTQPKNGSHRRDLERVWKAAIHGEDEEAKKTKFMDFKLLDEIYLAFEASYTIEQHRMIRGQWPFYRQGIEWGDMLRWVSQKTDNPSASHYLDYLRVVLKILIKQGKIDEVVFRRLGTREGILVPFDQEWEDKEMTERSKPKPPPPPKPKPGGIEAFKRAQAKYGYYTDAHGNTQQDLKRASKEVREKFGKKGIDY